MLRIVLASAALAAAKAVTAIPLTRWSLAQSADPQAASVPSFSPSPPLWAPATVPCTVLACQIQNGMYPGLYNDQVRAGSAATPFPAYSIVHPRPQPPQQNIYDVNVTAYNSLWTFRTTFTLPPSLPPLVTLKFDGLNYRGNLYMNGVLAAGNKTLVGAFTRFTIDVTALAIAGAANAIALELRRPVDRGLDETPKGERDGSSDGGDWRETARPSLSRRYGPRYHLC